MNKTNKKEAPLKLAPTCPSFTRRELLGIYQTIQAVLNPQTGRCSQCGQPGTLPTKYAYALAKNRRLLLAEIEPMSIKVNMMGMPFEYATAREEALKKASADPKTLKPVIVNGVYQINDPVGLKEAMDELDKTHKDELEEAGKFLDEEVEFEFYTIWIEEFPKEMLGVHMEALLPLVREDARGEGVKVN